MENQSGPVSAYALYGVHPHFSDQLDSVQCQVMKQLLKRKNVVGLGEIGLDYSGKNTVDRDVQIHAFEIQLKMALEKELPVCLHIRSAAEDGFQVLKRVRSRT